MAKRSTRFYRKNEAEVMHRLGINPTINSGAGWIQKEDGESDLFMCQLKSTDNKSISVKQEDINALEYHACTSHKIPIFALQFLTTDSVYVMIPEEEFKEYQEYKKAKQHFHKKVLTLKKKRNIIKIRKRLIEILIKCVVQESSFINRWNRRENNRKENLKAK